MIQRLIYDALQNGITRITDDHRLLDDIFGECGYRLAGSEVQAIQRVFTEQTPKVEHNFPRADSEFPGYFVILQDERESQHFLGEHVGMVDDPSNPDFGLDARGSIWDRNFQILCYTQHPEFAQYMYEIAKYIMMFNQVIGDFVVWEEMSGGDFLPQLDYLPYQVFGRALKLMIKDDHFVINRDSRVGKAFSLGGIYLENQTTGVVGRVTPVIGGNDNE